MSKLQSLKRYFGGRGQEAKIKKTPIHEMEPIEDPDELSDRSGSASDGDVEEKENEAPATSESSNKRSEDPEEKSEDLSGTDDDAMDTDNESSESDEESEKSDNESNTDSEDLSRLSHGELLSRIVTNEKFDRAAHTALISKKERYLLNVAVEARDQPVKITLSEWGSVPYFDTYIEEEVTLDPGANYNAQLIHLNSLLLKSYDSSLATLEFRKLSLDGFGTKLFKKFFGSSSPKIDIRSLNINNSELARLLEYVHPKELKIGFPSKHLFCKHGIFVDLLYLMIRDLNSLEVEGSEVDNVDQLMLEVRARHIKLGRNCRWSDGHFDAVMSGHAESNDKIDRTIECCYFNSDNMITRQRTKQHWNELLTYWYTIYKKNNPKYSKARITMTSTDNPKPTVKFLIDAKIVKPPHRFPVFEEDDIDESISSDSEGPDLRLLGSRRDDCEDYSDELLVALIVKGKNKFAAEVLRSRNRYLGLLFITFNSKAEAEVSVEAYEKKPLQQSSSDVSACWIQFMSRSKKLDVQFITGVIHAVLSCYNIAEAGVHFSQGTGKQFLTPEVQLPMESFFGKPCDDSSKKIKIPRLSIAPAAMVSVLRWFCPKSLDFHRTAKELFDDDGKLMIAGVEELALGDVIFSRDNVDELMRVCTAKKITLSEHTEWSDEAIFALLKDHVISSRGPVAPRTIIYNRVVGEYTRSYSDWQKFFGCWTAWYKANKSKYFGKVELKVYQPRISCAGDRNKVCVELSLH